MALESLLTHPNQIMDTKELMKLGGIGPAIYQKIEAKLSIEGNGNKIHGNDNVNNDQTLLPLPFKSLKKKRNPPNAPLSIPPLTIDDNDNQNEMERNLKDGQIGRDKIEKMVKSKKSIKCPKGIKKDYIPLYRSGPYAVLISLLKERHLNPYCSKREILQIGQPYCDAIMDEGQFDALTGALKTLLTKELIIKRGNPSKYSLTDSGIELARKIWESGEQRKSAPPLPVMAYLDKLLTEDSLIDSKNGNGLKNENNINGNDDSEQSQLALTTLQMERLSTKDNNNRIFTFCWSKDSYEIKLLIDARESKSKDQREFFMEKIQKCNVPCEQRNLELGDFLWIATRKKRSNASISSPFHQGNHKDNDNDNEEIVLGTIIERKTVEDLKASITDNRFNEQKFRIRNCGLPQPIYLIEETESMDYGNIGEEKFNAAIIQTQTNDGFHLFDSKSPEDTVKFIVSIHKTLVESLVNKREICGIRMNVPFDKKQFLDYMNDHIDHYMTFACFSYCNSKNATLKLQDLFIKQLLCIRQVSADKAALIVARFPTPIM